MACAPVGLQTQVWFAGMVTIHQTSVNLASAADLKFLHHLPQAH
jgi:hypothetical protein